MRDFTRLRAQLRVALARAALATGAGCSKDAKPTAPPVKASADARTGDTITHLDHAPDNLPSCPNGKWCGPAADAKPLARAESTEQLGCQTSLWVSNDTKAPVPKDFPGGGVQSIEATLDVPATQAKRDAKDTTTCCYDWVSPCPGGRPLLEGSRAVMAEAIVSDASRVWSRGWEIAGGREGDVTGGHVHVEVVRRTGSPSTSANAPTLSGDAPRGSAPLRSPARCSPGW